MMNTATAAREDAKANREALIQRYGTEHPAIAMVYSRVDHGPCDDGPSAYCPHCGAAGRYIHHAVLSDGGRIAAMSGCIQLFPQDRRYRWASRLVAEAYKREQAATEQGKKLAGWWSAMIEASKQVGSGEKTVEEWAAEMKQIESGRQEWLRRNGYK